MIINIRTEIVENTQNIICIAVGL